MDMEMLYSPEEILGLKKKKRIWTATVLTLAVGAFLGCVGLCLAADTANADRMERTVIVLSGAVGCLCLYLRRFIVEETGHEVGHAQMLLQGDDAEEIAGVLTVTKERLRIINSVTIRLISLDEDGKPRQLKVIESRVSRLAPYEGRAVRVRVVNGYIAGVAEL